jgi:hypothetical protein
MATLTPADTGIAMPVVPDSCKGVPPAQSDTEVAADLLADFINNALAPELTLVEWLEDKMRACCATTLNEYAGETDEAGLTACEMETDDLTESLWMLEGGMDTLTTFENNLLSCFESAYQGPSAFSMPGTNICAPLADTAVHVPSTVGDVEVYNDECDNLLPAI